MLKVANPNMAPMHSSVKQDWGTPIHLLKKWERDYHFYTVLDPCTSHDNPLNAEIFYTKDDDGLNRVWYIIDHKMREQRTLNGDSLWINPAVFVNPGYGIDYIELKHDLSLNSTERLVMDALEKGITRNKKIAEKIGYTIEVVKRVMKMLIKEKVIRKQGCGDWVEKAVKEHKRHGSTIVMLLPYKAPKWWHTYVKPYLKSKDEPLRHYFPLEGRIKFTGATQGAPFDSCLFILREEW